MPHELFPTTRQTTKTRNTFANNMSTDIKLSKTQISKITQSGEILRSNKFAIFKNMKIATVLVKIFRCVTSLSITAINK